MKQLQLMLRDRRRRQRGSILSSVLIIVAFLSILVGALMTELTNSFLLSRTLVTRMQSEATVSSVVELAINQLQNDAQSGAVPANCAKDARTAPSMPTLNQQFAHVIQQKCIAILPEVARSLAAGSFTVDGVHDTVAGRNRYLVSDTYGDMYSYDFSTGSLTWQVPIGGQATAPPLTKTGPDGSVDILVPVGANVVLFNEASRNAAPSRRCSMAASTTVSARPTAGANFPDDAFFGDVAGNLYVYDTRSPNCGPAPLTSAGVGGGWSGPRWSLRAAGVTQPVTRCSCWSPARLEQASSIGATRSRRSATTTAATATARAIAITAEAGASRGPP